LLDLKGRKKVAPILKPIAAGMAKVGFTPAVVTILGLLTTFVGAGIIASGELLIGGAVAAFKGAFLDTMSDRFGEIAVWVGLAVVLSEQHRLLVLCVVGLAFSLLVPYVRSKAELAGLEGQGEPLLWVFVILTGFTVFQRIRKTWQQLDS
jgi:phosphatidylglycerophosphate synthase